jgi:hypothetical protein
VVHWIVTTECGIFQKQLEYRQNQEERRRDRTQTRLHYKHYTPDAKPHTSSEEPQEKKEKLAMLISYVYSEVSIFVKGK